LRNLQSPQEIILQILCQFVAREKVDTCGGAADCAFFPTVLASFEDQQRESVGYGGNCGFLFKYVTNFWSLAITKLILFKHKKYKCA